MNAESLYKVKSSEKSCQPIYSLSMRDSRQQKLLKETPWSDSVPNQAAKLTSVQQVSKMRNYSVLNAPQKSALSAVIRGTVISWLVKRTWIGSLRAGSKKTPIMCPFAQCAGRELRKTKDAIIWHAFSATISSAGHVELVLLQKSAISQQVRAVVSKWWMRMSNQATTYWYRNRKIRNVARLLASVAAVATVPWSRKDSWMY